MHLRLFRPWLRSSDRVFTLLRKRRRIACVVRSRAYRITIWLKTGVLPLCDEQGRFVVSAAWLADLAPTEVPRLTLP